MWTVRWGVLGLWCGPSCICSIWCAVGERPLSLCLPHLQYLCPHPQSLGICHSSDHRGFTLSQEYWYGERTPGFSEWVQCLLSRGRGDQRQGSWESRSRGQRCWWQSCHLVYLSLPLLAVLCVVHTHPTDVPDTRYRTPHFSVDNHTLLKEGVSRIIMDLGLCISKCCTKATEVMLT